MAESIFMRFGAEFSEVNVDHLRASIGGFLGRGGIDSETTNVIETVVDELVCNILEHSQATWVELEIHPGEAEIRLMLRDDGREFDPMLGIHNADSATFLENSHERNLGLFMVGCLANACQYARVDGKFNELKFSVKKVEL